MWLSNESSVWWMFLCVGFDEGLNRKFVGSGRPWGPMWWGAVHYDDVDRGCATDQLWFRCLKNGGVTVCFGGVLGFNHRGLRPWFWWGEILVWIKRQCYWAVGWMEVMVGEWEDEKDDWYRGTIAESLYMKMEDSCGGFLGIFCCKFLCVWCMAIELRRKELEGNVIQVEGKRTMHGEREVGGERGERKSGKND